MYPSRPIAILLDFDGTMADSLSVMRSSYEQFLQSQGKVPSDNEFDSLNGPPLIKIVELLKDAHSMKASHHRLVQQYEEILDKSFATVKPAIGVFELLSEAKKNDSYVGIVTSNSSTRIKAWLTQHELSEKVDFVVGSEDVTDGKPSSEPYLVALSILRRFNASYALPDLASHCVAFEDSLNGAKSARGAGIYTFLLGSSVKHDGLEYHHISSLIEASSLFWLESLL